MIKNFIKTAWRNLSRNKVFSFINVFGLAVGLTCCMLISAYLYSELNYDTYPVNAKQIYRVVLRTINGNATTDFPNPDVAVGPGIKSAFPQVLDYTRLTTNPPAFVSFETKKFKENNIIGAEPNFFRMFSIPLLSGDSKTALTAPNSIVINKAIEKKYFGNSPGVGKALLIGGVVFNVTGVIDKVPDDSHFHADIFTSMSTYVKPSTRQSWSNIGFYTYLLLDKNTDPKQLEARFPILVERNVVPEMQHDMGISLAEARKSAKTFVFFLQPLTSIHLHSAARFEFEPNGDIHYVYIFGALAIFILLLACINFTNLSTASAAKRSKEIGIRKVLGSAKNKLVSQFLTESVMLTLLATAFAFGLVFLLLPYFNDVSGKQFTFGFFLNYKALLLAVGLTLFVGIVAGIYPAFFLSSFKIISILKGNGGSQQASKSNLRSSLIVFQFAISTALIIATFVVYQQLHYMQNKKLGYNKDQVLVINDGYVLGNNIVPLKQQLLSDNRVVNATISDNIPTYNNAGGTVIYVKELADKGSRSEIATGIYWVENSYVPTLGMQIVKGRNFYPPSPADSISVIINEAAVRDLGIGSEDPIGKTIIRSGQRHYTIVGVIKDFNTTSAKQKIAPLMILPIGKPVGNLIVRVKTRDVGKLVADIKTKWGAYSSGEPFSYSFLDDKFASLYKAEERTGKIFTSFAIIAVIIASLGLLGLAAFMIRQRVKEIGIRKVLGASSGSITFMLSKEFLKLIVIASLIAMPVTWYAMSKWLQDFAYRINIEWWVFLLAGIIALLVAAITISFQSIKASLANPVKSLRSE